MRRKLLIFLLIALALLTACDYMVVEDNKKTTIGSLLIGSAAAEEEKSEDAPLFNEIENESDHRLYLESGMCGEDVKELQALLIKHGFMNGRADGIFGKQTENGVKGAQDYKDEIDREKAEEKRKTILAAIQKAEKRALERLNALTITEDKSALTSQADFSFVNIFKNHPKEDKEELKSGACDDLLYDFLKSEITLLTNELKRGDRGLSVRRLQMRLYGMNYLPGGIDGQFGNETFQAVKYFQRLNGIKETGVADENTQKMLFSEECKKAEHPVYRYKVEISISKQKVYVYEWNYGSYSKLVKTMKCTTGAVDTPTPIGSYKMGGPCGRWYYFKKFDCWAQYASRIVGGILFHSVIYSEKDVSTLRHSTVNALGTRGSHGCVRLSVENAEWIYRNIPAGTTCRIYN